MTDASTPPTREEVIAALEGATVAAANAARAVAEYIQASYAQAKSTGSLGTALGSQVNALSLAAQTFIETTHNVLLTGD